MLDPVLLVVLMLAVARMVILVVDDTITRPFRTWVAGRFGEDHMVTFGVNCPWCVGVWFAFPMTAITYATGHVVWQVILTALAVSYVASKIADW